MKDNNKLLNIGITCTVKLNNIPGNEMECEIFFFLIVSTCMYQPYEYIHWWPIWHDYGTLVGTISYFKCVWRYVTSPERLFQTLQNDIKCI